MLKYIFLSISISIVFFTHAMQTIPMRPVSLKFQMLCKFLEEDAFQKELASLAQEYTFEEKIALQVPDEQFRKMHCMWVRSSLHILALKYPNQEKK